MREGARVSIRVVWIMVVAVAIAIGLYPASVRAQTHAPRTPIKHLIVIVGENRTFDHLFATYAPAKGETVFNLRSEGIVNADGSPGPNFSRAQQWEAEDKDRYSIAPNRTRPFDKLPQPNTTRALGQPPVVVDGRFPANLPNGPFQLSKYAPYQLSYTGDPVHRFFQMWQQYDEGRDDLFTWVGITIGSGSNGKAPPSPFDSQSTHQGS
ncbi:MAG TPA: alkaline phosphatase family protein, partial [Candidatus Binataceae bacterium]|nr:alkaline phosphatase family protein [Candidatus Binataceae bacterium]